MIVSGSPSGAVMPCLRRRSLARSDWSGAKLNRFAGSRSMMNCTEALQKLQTPSKSTIAGTVMSLLREPDAGQIFARQVVDLGVRGVELSPEVEPDSFAEHRLAVGEGLPLLSPQGSPITEDARGAGFAILREEGRGPQHPEAAEEAGGHG